MRRLFLSVLSLALALPAVNIGSVAWAHDAVNFSLTRFRVAEGSGPAEYVVSRGTHGTGPTSVRVVSTGVDATAGSDFTPVDERVRFTSPVENAEAFVPVLNDSEIEPLERVELSLEDPDGGTVIGYPNSALVMIVDDDGPARIGLEDASYSVFESRSAVDVWVIRSGDVSGSAAVDYSTVDGTAIAGRDYSTIGGTLVFDASQRYKRLTIPVIDNDSVDGDLTFSLQLSGITGADTDEVLEATVVIRDDESGAGDQIAPYTAFHQPLDGKRYKRLRDFLVFMQDDEGGSGIARVELALRRKHRAGHCTWWTGKRFKRGGCGSIRWSKEGADYFTTLALFRLPKPLKSTSMKTGIKHYTAYSRGFDRVGNEQTLMDRGQNFNRFKVK